VRYQFGYATNSSFQQVPGKSEDQESRIGQKRSRIRQLRIDQEQITRLQNNLPAVLLQPKLPGKLAAKEQVLRVGMRRMMPRVRYRHWRVLEQDQAGIGERPCLKLGVK
jgi:hypothetical protein